MRMRIPLAWLACAVLAAARLGAQSGPVLYPRSPSAQPAPAGAPAAGGMAVTVAVVLAGAAAGWYLWRRLRSAGRPGSGAQQLAIAETRALGNRQFLVVAAYGERKFLLGVCPGRIELLAPLDGKGPPPAA